MWKTDSGDGRQVAPGDVFAQDLFLGAKPKLTTDKAAFPQVRYAGYEVA